MRRPHGTTVLTYTPTEGADEDSDKIHDLLSDLCYLFRNLDIDYVGRVTVCYEPDETYTPEAGMTV